MLLRNGLHFLSRPSLILRARFKSTNGYQRHQLHDDAAVDFRPPWVYTASRLMIFTIIPGIVVYSVFFYDFGDRDHVFQPARKWALEQKSAFFSLSPDEEKLLKANKGKLDNS